MDWLIGSRTYPDFAVFRGGVEHTRAMRRINGQQAQEGQEARQRPHGSKFRFAKNVAR
jgi:hypothetical protein